MAGGLTHNSSKELVIQSSLVPGALTDFPLLLTVANLPSEMFDADGASPAQNGGGDIRFTSDAAGTTLLNCEVVSFVTNTNPALGTAEIWVKVPSVSASVNTSIYVWYNTAGTDSQPAVTASGGRNGVWADYARVYHLSEPSGSFVDSTGSGNNGTAVGTIGRAAAVGAFDGIDLGSTIRHSNYVEALTLGLSASTSYTFQLWVDLVDEASQGSFVGIVADGGSTAYNYFGAQRDSDTSDWRVHVNPSGRYQDLGTSFNDLAGAGVVLAHFRHIAGTSAAVFSNGAGLATDTTPPNTSNNDDSSPTLKIGNARSGGAGVGGKIAQLKIRLAALTDDWITAEYNNQNDPATFVIEGAAPPATTNTRLLTLLGVG